MSTKLQYSAQQSSQFSGPECRLRFLRGGSMVGGLRLSILVILASMVLVACGEEAEQRRFATDDQPSFVAASPSIQATQTVAASPRVVAVLSPESLLAGAEATGTVFLQNADGVWAVDTGSGDAARVYTARAGERLVMAPGANADRVAILTSGEGPGEMSTLLVIGADGETLQTFDGIEEAFSETGDTVTPVSLDWSHDGQRLLAGFQGGGLLDVPLDGEPSMILSFQRIPYLEEARWSPVSDMIAYVAREEAAGPGRLFVAKPRGGATDPVVLAPARGTTGQSVQHVAWAEGGEAILYVQTSSTTAITGQDLFAVSPSGEERRLVASGGRVAPIGGVERFVVSPDGRSVAYAIYVPGRDEPEFNSLWIESLENETRYQVPVSSGDTVTSLRWTASGLVWETTVDQENGTSTAGEPVLYLLGPDLIPQRVESAGATPESATPGASPVPASPAA